MTKIDSLDFVPNAKTPLVIKPYPKENIEIFENNNTKINVDELTISNKNSEVNSKENSHNKKGLIKTAFGILVAGVTVYLLKHPLIKTTITKPITRNIEPKSFREAPGKDKFPEFLDKYINDVESYAEHITIKPEYNPRTLKPVVGLRRTLDASNFDFPYGTIAIPAKLDETLSTSGLLQCSAMAIVDRTQNLQTLVHCCPTIGGNESLLKYIFSHSNPKNLDITIVPGSYKETDTTIDFLVNMVKKHAPEAKLNFANFPDIDNCVAILENGILKCGTRENIIATVNPKTRIINA